MIGRKREKRGSWQREKRDHRAGRGLDMQYKKKRKLKPTMRERMGSDKGKL